MKNIKEKILKFCLYRERCEFEVKKKLKVFQINEKEINKIVNELKLDNFIDNKRFTKSYIRGKYEYKNWGFKKIKFHLNKFNIPEKLITEQLNKIDSNSYDEKIKKIIRYKIQSYGDSKFLKKKIFSFMISKGYEYSRIEKNYNELKYN